MATTQFDYESSLITAIAEAKDLWREVMSHREVGEERMRLIQDMYQSIGLSPAYVRGFDGIGSLTHKKLKLLINELKQYLLADLLTGEYK